MRLFQKDAVPGHDSLIERKPRLGTVLIGEFTACVIVRPPRNRGRQAVQDCGFRVLQVRQPEYCFGVRLHSGFPMPPFSEHPHRHGLSSCESFVATIGFAPERPGYAKRIYKRTEKGRAPNVRQELHNAGRPSAPQRRAAVSAHQGAPGRDGGGGVGCEQRRSQ